MRLHNIFLSKDGDVSSIQEAIDLAKPYDSIYIKNGKYLENIVIDKPIHLIGENRISTIINGRNAGNVIKINAEEVIIEQLTIEQSGSVFPNAGINISSSNITIKHCLFYDNFYGMTLYNAHFNNILNNSIHNDINCGIYMSTSSYNYFENNLISNNTYNGIGVYDSSNYNRINNNTISKNGYCGINLRISSDNMITGNNFVNNNIGIHVPTDENTIQNNTFVDNNVNFDEEFTLPGTPGFETIYLILLLIVVTVFFIVLKNRKKNKYN